MADSPNSPVINDSDEFVPMPTPNQVVAGGAGAQLDPVPFQFNDIRALAARILKRAQEQGQAKIEAARKQVADMEKQASDKAYKEAFPKGEKEGFAKGEKEGREAAQAEMQQQLEQERAALRQESEQVRGILEQLAGIMNDNRQQLLAQAEGDLLLLALDIAKRLVGHELSIDPEAIRPLAIEAIGLVTNRSAITARVNPDDYKVMQDLIPDLQAIFPDLGSVQVESDASIERGGIIAATRESEVDMQLAIRLATFEEAILGFSGDAAVAPWSSIPADAVEQYKQQMTSQQQMEVFPELAQQDHSHDLHGHAIESPSEVNLDFEQFESTSIQQIGERHHQQEVNHEQQQQLQPEAAAVEQMGETAQPEQTDQSEPNQVEQPDQPPDTAQPDQPVPDQAEGGS